MKRLLVCSVALGVVLSLASSCEVVGSNVAATVDGKDITVDQVKDLGTVLAKQSAQSGGSATVEDKTTGLDATIARKSLSEWIQLIGSEQALARLGTKASASDRSSAESSAKSLTGVSAATKKELVEALASYNTLIPKLAVDSNPVYRKLALAALQQIPASQRKQTCSTAIFGPAAGADQVQTLLDSGTTLDDTSAFSAAGYSAASSSSSLCLSSGDTSLPTELSSVYFTTPAGTVNKATFSNTGQDGTPETDTIFFEILGTKNITTTSSEISQSVLQNGAGVLLGAEFKKLSIHVDPRFGAGYSLKTGNVIPPDSPVVPTTKPKVAAKAKSPAATGSTATSTPSG